jgi:tetratricopeptide (TPR) repeat protein
MKSERRHELEQNELADWIAKSGERIKPYQNVILGAVILVAAGIIAYSLWTRQAQAQRDAGWDRYYGALNTGEPGELEDLVEHYPGTTMANWAATVAGDLRLANATGLLFTDKASAQQNITKAIDLYKQVLEKSRDSMLRERATFGLAQAYESQVDLDKATEQYQKVVDDWPDGAYAAAARERLMALQEKPVRDLYRQFAQWEPTPEFDDAGALPTDEPAFDLDALPEGPVFTPKTTFGMDDEVDVEVDVEEPAGEGTESDDTPSESDKAEPTEPEGGPAESEGQPTTSDAAPAESEETSPEPGA